MIAPRAVLASLATMLVGPGCRADAAPTPAGLAATAPVVEVLDPAGAIDAPAVQDALSRVTRELARCGTDAGWTGDAMAWIVIDWHGKVDRLELAVDRPAVETCFTAELRKLVVPRAQGPATVFARLRVAPAPAGARPAGPPDDAAVKRGEVRATRIVPGPQFADPERVRDALRQQLQDATVCYEQALATAPRLVGTAAIELTVAATGAVDSVSVGSAPGNLADCLKRAMLRVRLPAPSATDKVRVELQLGPTR